MSEPERAAAFYSKVWNLTEVARSNGSYWFRGTGAYHHILAIHPATKAAAIRRLTFAAATKDIVQALHAKVAASGCTTEAPHARWPLPAAATASDSWMSKAATSRWCAARTNTPTTPT